MIRHMTSAKRQINAKSSKVWNCSYARTARNLRGDLMVLRKRFRFLSFELKDRMGACKLTTFLLSRQMAILFGDKDFSILRVGFEVSRK